jgi:membrane fusion protein (multidrug efflux system)
MAGRFIISTDDAYVQAELSIISSKIAGHVTAVPVKANQRVKAGEIIAVIDPGDLQLAVDAAKAKISTQTAVRDRVARAIDVQNAVVAQAMSQVRAAAADADRAAGDYVRSETLAARDFTSKQRLDNARADRDRSAATLASARAALAAAQASTEVLKAQKLEVERALIELQVALARAERDLDFTRIRAPVDGVIGNKVIEVGQFIQAGMRLMAIVPLQAIYVEANFKETQISGMKPGQPVRIKIDALPEHDVRGQVDSISPASGAVFSLLPPENATGNFTKIVQRVPVRVAITAEDAARERLRAGLSVVVSVDTSDNSTAAASGTKGSAFGVAARSPR